MTGTILQRTAVILGLLMASLLLAPGALATSHEPPVDADAKNAGPKETDNTGPLVLFLLVISILVAAVAGFFVGMLTSRPHTSGLTTALATARPRVQQTALRLRGVSAKIAQSDRARERGGNLLVMSSTLTNVANDLSRLESLLKKNKGGA